MKTAKILFHIKKNYYRQNGKNAHCVKMYLASNSLISLSFSTEQ